MDEKGSGKKKKKRVEDYVYLEKKKETKIKVY
jgi:hypothetical protein